MTAGIFSDVTIQWNEAMDITTISPATIMIAGRWSGVQSGTFSLENGNTLLRFTPAEPFAYGEWVTVAVSKGVENQSGVPIEKGYAWNFWTAAGAGSLDQTEIEVIEVRLPGEPHIQTYGAHAADLNNDGWSDITLPNELSNDIRIFLNDGSGGYDDFEIVPVPTGSVPSTNEAMDLDGDADFDFVVGNGGNNRLSIFIGDGAGSFGSATSYQAGTSVRGVAGIDLEGDADIDIITANRTSSNLTIFLNNGDGTLQPAIPMDANGSQETACAAADANNDGILDLFVGAIASNEIILLLGDGDGGLTFSDEVGSLGATWMLAAGDVNGDGNVDVVAANSSNNNASVVLGDGQGGLLPAVSYPVGSFALAIDLADIDGDGDLDLVTSNFASDDWTIYENDGTGVYGNPRTLNASNAGSCATLHDRDNDGDLDITGIDEIDDLIFIFENPGSSGISCGSIFFFNAKCNANGAAQAMVKMTGDFTGETVTFDLDGDDYISSVMSNGTNSIAKMTVPHAGMGSHTVTLEDPAGCYSPVVFNCQVDAAPDPEWGALWAEYEALEAQAVPAETRLDGNYPNPFNPSTTFRYSLSEPGYVSLKVYNTLGQLVRTVVDQQQLGGHHETVWDGRNETGATVASGVYVYRMTAGSYVETRRMLLVK